MAAVHDAASSSTRYVDLSQDGAGSAVELVLDATGVVRGSVEFANGEPVGEAVIVAEPASALVRGRVEGTLRGKHVTVADPGGRFEVRGLVHGTYNLRAAALGIPLHQRLSWMGTPVRVETGGSEVVVRMRRGGSLSGQVRLEDGAVPAAFTVTLRGGSGTSFGGGDGRFPVNGIPAGEYTVFVSGPGFLTKSLPALKVEEDQDTNLGAVALSRGRRLTGRVASAAGAPVRATVTVSQQLRGCAVMVGSAAELEHGLQQVSSDAEGHFVLEGLPISILQLGAEHPVEGRSAFVRVEEGVPVSACERVAGPSGAADDGHHAHPLTHATVVQRLFNPCRWNERVTVCFTPSSTSPEGKLHVSAGTVCLFRQVWIARGM
ncbi:carboxypeptidase-like regulatory domain-containing protein [Myxococcus xanthus]|uniref:carboxypeptidase-like regulatory domain-containing protein n=2 Tax=Myxococcus xanthus TaxID=34 RepID=UPI0013760DD6|nr:carboxypeptidase-like regulatory domain-containing protein [Myxococcus xanthus]